ncbi:MAG: RlmE family RNA methyltransferase [Rhodospirillales bacterium]|jgi:23S rRNA (uridine2552-2'-O)-methyltransferase
MNDQRGKKTKAKRKKQTATQFTGRGMATRVKTAKGRKSSSTRWLQRQLNDPYVAEAQTRGYRSRAAFKLLELNERFNILSAGQNVVDLGAAPGGWTQVIQEKLGNSAGAIVAVDQNEIEPLDGVTVLKLDIYEENAPDQIKAALNGQADVVLSDMAPAATGHRSTDHLRIIGLCEAALDIAINVLSPGGTLIAKVWQGGTEQDLLTQIKKSFKQVKHAKPPASRADSAEVYVVAQGFRITK